VFDLARSDRTLASLEKEFEVSENSIRKWFKDSGSKRVTFGEPDDESRTFGFALTRGTPAATAAGVLAYVGVGAPLAPPRGSGMPVPSNASPRAANPLRHSCQNAAL